MSDAGCLISAVDASIKTIGLSGEYGRMLDIIQRSEREIAVATAQHGKTHSQFQYATLDCSGPVGGFTKIRNWRQVLAVIERTRDALEDAAFALRRQELQESMYRRRAEANEGEAVELLLLKAEESGRNAERTRRAMAGAVRKLAAYTLQFRELERQIRAELGKPADESITEEDFERDEERFHIMKAFQQALVAHRALGRVDHGDMIYFDDIGIGGALAQDDIRVFLANEARYREIHPTHVHQVHALERTFLADMARKYSGCSSEVARAKGLLPGVLLDATLRLQRKEDAT